MAAGDFTNLAAIKATGIITGTANDTYLERLITAASSFMANWMNNPILEADYSGKFSGLGNNVQSLPNTPVTAVASVQIDGVDISESSDGVTQPGFVFDSFAVYLIGGAAIFTRNKLNVWIDYTAGYAQADAFDIPATPFQLPVGASQFSRPWGGDRGVVYTSSGASLAKVTTPPTAGQYSVDSDGLYTFAAADFGQNVTIRYGAAPFDIEEACIELILLKFKQNAKINIASESLTQQSITYNTSDMTRGTRQALLPYKRVVPV